MDGTIKLRREKVLRDFCSLCGVDLRSVESGNGEFVSSTQHSSIETHVTGNSDAGTGFLGLGLNFESVCKPDLLHLFHKEAAITLPSLNLYDAGSLDLDLLCSGKTEIGQSYNTPSQHLQHETQQHLYDGEGDAQQTKQIAITSLSNPKRWTGDACAKAAGTIARSFSVSFSSLVDSRMKSCTLVLLRHSLEADDGNGRSRSRLLALLSTGNCMRFSAFSASFHALSLPTNVESAVLTGESQRVILPLIFEANFEIFIRGKITSSKVQAPGTVQGTFIHDTEALEHVYISLDAQALVDQMIEQARLVVVQAVATATTLPGAGGLNIPAQLQPQIPSEMEVEKSFPRRFSMESESTHASDLPPHPSSALQSFASMKLVNKLKSGGKDKLSSSSAALTIEKKNRSVTFKASTMDCFKPSSESDSHSSKKQKKDPTRTTKMRSSKSFGKPNAELFENSRNATFADFGRAAMSHHIPSFSDAQKQANKNISGPTVNFGRNATFAHLSNHSSGMVQDRKVESKTTYSNSFELRRPQGGNHGLERRNGQGGSSSSGSAGSGFPARQNSLLESFASASGQKKGSKVANLDDFLS